jgi:hypothetical protein
MIEALLNALPTLGLIAGLLGPAVFVGGFLVLGWLRTDYSPRYTFASQLALNGGGRVWQVLNCSAGLLIAAFGLAISARFATEAAPAWGGCALVIAGVGFVIFGLSKDDPWLLYPPPKTVAWIDLPVTLHGWGHQIGALIAGVGLLAGHFSFAWHFATQGDVAWYLYSVITGVAFPVLYASGIASGWVSGRSTGRLGGNGGLLQKLSMSTSLLWVALLAAFCILGKP